jgi:transcription initiation factor IIE alpha subunit
VITNHSWCTYPKEFKIKNGDLSYVCDCMYYAIFDTVFMAFNCCCRTYGDENHLEFECRFCDSDIVDMECWPEWYTDDFRENNC